MNEYENKLLVALDGSAKSAKTIHHLCTFRPFREKELVLFNVMSKVPECYYDLKKEPFSYNVTSQVHAWEAGCRTLMDKFMNESRNKLVASGFDPEKIHTRISDRKEGVARDILTEARKGYHAMVLRRRGWATSVLPVIMGSVSTKLIEKAVDVPIILTGVEEVTHHLLLALDGSSGAQRAAEYTARMVQGSGCRIVIASVIRDFYGPDESRYPQEAGDCVGNGFQAIQTSQNEAAEKFIQAGLHEDQIVKKITKGARSRSGAIVEMAMEEGCDTVIFGRRGKSEVSDFNIGRVPWKVLQGARKLTVWMVP